MCKREGRYKTLNISTSSLNRISTFITPLPALGTFLHRKRLFVQLQYSKTCSEGSWKCWAESSKIGAPQNVPLPTAHCWKGLGNIHPLHNCCDCNTYTKPTWYLLQKTYWAPASSSIPIPSFPSLCCKDLFSWGNLGMDGLSTSLTVFSEQTWVLLPHEEEARNSLQTRLLYL